MRSNILRSETDVHTARATMGGFCIRFGYGCQPAILLAEEEGSRSHSPRDWLKTLFSSSFQPIVHQFSFSTRHAAELQGPFP